MGALTRQLTSEEWSKRKCNTVVFTLFLCFKSPSVSHRRYKEEISVDIILKISIVLAVGFLGGKLAGLLKLPSVSGYLVIGLLLGPSFFNFVSATDSKSLEIISELALAFIAFSIGSEFVVKDMAKYGKSIFIIALAEVIGAIALVFSLMYFIFNMDFAFSIVIASMSAATAPAATLMVIRQYRAYGPLTKTILPVVALDDAIGIMAFGIALSLAKISTSGTKASFSSILLDPLVEIIGSLLLGLVIGVVLAIVLKKLKAHDDFQVTSLIAISLGLGASNMLGLSSLLCNMMIGATLVNLVQKPDRVFKSVNNFVAAFYVLFFTLAGASLDLGILKSIGLIGITYVIARGLGKYLGAYMGCKSVKSEKAVTKYLGLALFPQGGVSIGLSVLVRQHLPQYATAITTIIMFSVLIYETTGPIFSKIAIQKAGEVNGLDNILLEQESEPVTDDSPKADTATETELKLESKLPANTDPDQGPDTEVEQDTDILTDTEDEIAISDSIQSNESHDGDIEITIETISSTPVQEGIEE